MTTSPLNQFLDQARGKPGVLIIEDIDRSGGCGIRRSAPKGLAAVYACGATGQRVERQLSICREYIVDRGMTLLANYVDRPAVDGNIIRRPALSTLMDAAARGEFGVLVIENPDRLCRDHSLLHDLFTRLSVLGIEVHQPGRGRLGVADFCFSGFMGEEERRMMRERARHGLRHCAREGRIPGRTCYGYRKVPGRPGKPSVIRSQADVVRDAFRMRADGMGCTGIAAALNRASGSRRRWTGGGIARMLRNPLYDGVLVHGRTIADRDAFTGMPMLAPKAPETWVVTQVERLRIVDHEIWLVVQASFRRPGGRR